MLQRPRGTRDFLPEEMERRRLVEARMREVARRWGYREICTPAFEHLDLFTMKSGEGIIGEMYTFEDKGGRKLTLRPEVTASVLRCYVQEGRTLPKPLRWCYLSDCFRYERPQKGRYRQFWQFGVELIGADTPAADAESILLADDILSKVGLEYTLHVGHLAPMKHLLRDLDEGLQRQVMGLLDKRDMEGLMHLLGGHGCEDLYSRLTALLACRDCGDLFEICGEMPELKRIEEVISLLDAAAIEYTLNFGIARGLDYYTGTVFEAYAENLGAENQVLGGGTYRLAYLFGGDDVASCGFAIGFDRVLVSLGEVPVHGGVQAAIVCTPEARGRGFEVARAFRDAGIITELELMGRGIGAQIAHAARNCDFVVIVGAREIESGSVTLKNLDSGEQMEMEVADAIAGVKAFGSR